MIVVSIPVRLHNPLNGPQGFTRGAVMSAAAKRKRIRTLVAFVLRPKLRQWPLVKEVKLVVTMTRIAPRPFDDDGAAASMKSIRDGVADALGVNDADPRVIWRVTQRRGAPKTYACEIKIERAESS